MPTPEGYKKNAYKPTMPKIEEEETEGKGLKLLTPNNLLTRLPVLFVLIKAANNSYKLKRKLDKYCIFCINIIKSLNSFTTI